MRAVEIASITWAMVTDAEGEIGDVIALQNRASKGRGGGRIIPMHPDLKAALDGPPSRARRQGTIQIGQSSTASATAVCRRGRSLCGFTGCIPELGMVGCS